MALLFSNLIVFLWSLCCRFVVSYSDRLGNRDNLEVFNRKCYEFINKRETRDAAINTCKKRGGILAEIRNRDIQNFIINTVKSELNLTWEEMHTGAVKETGEGPYFFQNGDELSFHNWDDGQTFCIPDLSFLCIQNCAVLDLVSTLWGDTMCYESYYYACEYNVDPCNCEVICKCQVSKPSPRMYQKHYALTDLRIDKKTLSSYKRKISSAYDERLSSKVMGGFGGGIIVSAVLVIVLPDLYKLCLYLKRNRGRQQRIGV